MKDQSGVRAESKSRHRNAANTDFRPSSRSALRPSRQTVLQIQKPGHQPGWRRRSATARWKKQCLFPFKNTPIYQLGQLRERVIPVDQLRQRLAEQFSCLWPLRLRSHRHSEFARKCSYSNPSLQITTSEIHCLLY